MTSALLAAFGNEGGGKLKKTVILEFLQFLNSFPVNSDSIFGTTMPKIRKEPQEKDINVNLATIFFYLMAAGFKNFEYRQVQDSIGSKFAVGKHLILRNAYSKTTVRRKIAKLQLVQDINDAFDLTACLPLLLKFGPYLYVRTMAVSATKKQLWYFTRQYAKPLGPPVAHSTWYYKATFTVTGRPPSNYGMAMWLLKLVHPELYVFHTSNP